MVQPVNSPMNVYLEAIHEIKNDVKSGIKTPEDVNKSINKINNFITLLGEQEVKTHQTQEIDSMNFMLHSFGRRVKELPQGNENDFSRLLEDLSEQEELEAGSNLMDRMTKLSDSHGFLSTFVEWLGAPFRVLTQPPDSERINTLRKTEITDSLETLNNTSTSNILKNEDILKLRDALIVLSSLFYHRPDEPVTEDSKESKIIFDLNNTIYNSSAPWAPLLRGSQPSQPMDESYSERIRSLSKELYNSEGVQKYIKVLKLPV